MTPWEEKKQAIQGVLWFVCFIIILVSILTA